MALRSTAIKKIAAKNGMTEVEFLSIPIADPEVRAAVRVWAVNLLYSTDPTITKTDRILAQICLEAAGVTNH